MTRACRDPALLAKVSPKFRTPVAAIWTGSILSVLFVWCTSAITIGGTPAYSIVVSCTVIFLFLSFALPIALGFLAHRHAEMADRWARGISVLARFKLVAVLALISHGR